MDIKRLLCLSLLLTFVAWPLRAEGREAFLARIRTQLESVFDDPAYFRALWAVKVQSMESGEVLFEKNPDKYVMPASNMKLLTAVSAIEELGLDYTFETRLETDGEVAAGTLQGNLFVAGSGDPTLGARLSSPDPEKIEEGDPLAIFRDWAAQLKAKGILRIEGDVIGDDSIFDDISLGSGWSWDNLPYGYSSELGGLQYNENYVLLKITSADSSSGPRVEMLPSTSYLKVENRLIMAEEGAESDYEVVRAADPNSILLTGRVARSDKPFWRSVSIHNPTLYFATVLRETFQAEGIDVAGSAVDLDDRAEPVGPDRTTLLVYKSPPLSYLLRVLLKISQNLYAETLVKLLDPQPRSKSYEGGRERVTRVLTRAGLPEDAYVLADGSGLSRYSYLTADSLVRLLHYVYRRPYRDQLLDYLPLAAVDGTLSDRLKATPAENNVRAKTGTISNVRALSGYVTTRDGEVLAFSMIVNHYTQPRRSAEYLQDLALELLSAASSRENGPGGH